EGALAVLEELLGDAADQAGVEVGNGPVAEVAELLLAGIDFPSEEVELRAAVEERGWARRTVVGNDTFAVLRAGTERGWGVAVVCGAGINCVGVSPDGRHARFPALGPTTGDWGGGYDLGLAAVSAPRRRPLPAERARARPRAQPRAGDLRILRLGRPARARRGDPSRANPSAPGRGAASDRLRRGWPPPPRPRGAR